MKRGRTNENKEINTINKDLPMHNLDLWMSPYQSIEQYPVTFTKHLLKNQGYLGQKEQAKEIKEQFNYYEDTIHTVMRVYLLLGQCFGLLPVKGIFSSNPKDVMFTWKSKRVAYALFLLVTLFVVTILEITSSVLYYGFNYKTADSLIEYLLTFSQMIVFIGQARTWPKLIVNWTNVELKTRRFYPVAGMKNRINLFVFLFSLGTLFLIAARVIGYFPLITPCSRDVWILLQLSIVVKYQSIFSIIGFSFTKAVILVVIFLHNNIMMVYDELTITVLASYLKEQFVQLYNHLGKIQNQRMPSSYWAEMRETYNSLSCLTKELDSHLSWMTLMCFGANLYNICSLLLKTLSPDMDKLAIYCILYILVFTAVRTFVAALIASSVYEESKKPLYILFSVRSDSYNAEVCRFQMQVAHDQITLTGCNFFSLTRSFMLTVAGTIATYEIVLLQFGSLNDNIETYYNNSTTGICNKLLDIVYQ